MRLNRRKAKLEDNYNKLKTNLLGIDTHTQPTRAHAIQSTLGVQSRSIAVYVLVCLFTFVFHGIS